MAYSEPGKTRNRVFQFVQDRIHAGEPPTVREVQEAFGFRSVQTAREHLETLVAEGRLVKEANKARSYRLPEGTYRPEVRVPLLGRVRAGPLTEAVQDLEGYIGVETRYPKQELFALRVRGESMKNAAILPDDIVVVRTQPTAENGDIVVALIEDEATVKRLVVRNRRVELHPENPSFSPIVPDPEAVRILGKVIEVRRYLETLVYPSFGSS